MTTRSDKKANLIAELNRINQSQKAKYREAEAEILARYRRHQELLEADTISAIAIIVRKGLFAIEDYRNKATVQDNKDINERRQIIVDLVKNKDCLGAMKALKKELDWAIEWAEQVERERC